MDYVYPENTTPPIQGYSGPFNTRPGLALTGLLFDLNSERVNRKIEEAIEAAPAFKYALLGAAYCNLLPSREHSSRFSLEDFIPDHLLNAYQEPKDYLKTHTGLLGNSLEGKIRLHAEATKEESTGKMDDTANMGRLGGEGLPPFLIHPSLAPIKYVMELAQLNIRDWSMSFSDTSVRLASGSLFAVPERFIAKIAWGGRSRLSPMPRQEGGPCSKLSAKSLEALAHYSLQNGIHQ